MCILDKEVKGGTSLHKLHAHINPNSVIVILDLVEVWI